MLVWPRLLIIALAFCTGWLVNGWRMDARTTKQAEASARALQVAIKQRDSLSVQLAKTNDDALKKLQGAQNETNHLRDCLRVGNCGLRIAARCPAPPTAAPGAGVDSGDAAQLTAASGLAYFALRDGIDRATAQLTACQGLLSQLPRE